VTTVERLGGDNLGAWDEARASGQRRAQAAPPDGGLCCSAPAARTAVPKSELPDELTVAPHTIFASRASACQTPPRHSPHPKRGRWSSRAEKWPMILSAKSSRLSL